MREQDNDSDTKLLYIAYCDALPDKTTIGITSGTFEERWRTPNRTVPAELERKEYFSIRLPKADAERVEKQVKSKYTEKNLGEWVPWPPEKLKEIVVGLVFILCKNARKDLTRVVDGRKQRDYAGPIKDAPKGRSKGPVKRKDRVAYGLCRDCGNERDDPRLQTRCWACNEAVKAQIKKRKAEKAGVPMLAKDRVAHGLCRDCGKKRDNPNNNTRCRACQHKVSVRDKIRQAEKNQGRVKIKDRVALGLCIDCGQKRDDPNLQTRCRACNEEVLRKQKAKRDQNRYRHGG